MEKLLLSVEEAGKVLGFGRSRMYELINSGEVPSIRIGRLIKISPDALNKWIEKQNEGGE